jgi:DNA polymerase elongation subunit (family B)
MSDFYTNVALVGNKFLVRGYENGMPVAYKGEYQPTLFVKSNRPTEYKTLNGEFVEPIQPGTVRDCRDWYKKYEDVDNFTIYGYERYLYQYISDKYTDNEIKFDMSKIKLVTLDIETQAEYGFPDPKVCAEEILLITIQDNVTKKIKTWGTRPYTPKQDNVEYIECAYEADLLNSFLDYWANNPPDVITGWNIRFFDLPYIFGRVLRVLGESHVKLLSPWGLVSSSEVMVDNRQQVKVDLVGISQLDYLELYKKFTYKAQESYRLDYIAEIELGQKKLDHSEFETFRDFYRGNWDKFVDYNVIDVELVDRLEDKMKLIELALTMAYDAKVNYEDVFYQVRMWDNIIYLYLKERNIVVPPKSTAQRTDKYAGAYVKEPVPGVYDWVVSLDVDSMYPHIIMQLNLGPDTLVEERCQNVSVEKILNQEVDLSAYNDYAVAPNGAMYRKDKRGILPELMLKMYNERVAYKKRMLAEQAHLEQIEEEMKSRGLL